MCPPEPQIFAWDVEMVNVIFDYVYVYFEQNDWEREEDFQHQNTCQIKVEAIVEDPQEAKKHVIEMET